MDWPWASRPVTIELKVRRFFCDNSACEQRIFTERLPSVAAPWARQTQRLQTQLQAMGCQVGGAASAVLCQALGCPLGADAIIALVRKRTLTPAPTPRVLGVDDWAKRKGQTYGTILVDHERACVVDVLNDRTPEALAHWLRAHPGAEIVTRDRAEAYAQGIRDGAPSAVQVADRWHLLKNVTDLVSKLFQDHHAAIQIALSQAAPSAAPVVDQPVVMPPALEMAVQPEPPEPSAADLRRQQRAATAHALHRQGWGIKAIAHHLRCASKTVSRYLQRSVPLAPRRTVRATKLDHHQAYLLERWHAGCHNAAQLTRDLRARGFEGGHTIVRRFVADLRRLSGLPKRSRRAGGQAVSSEQLARIPSCRKLAWMSAQRTPALDQNQLSLLAQVAAIDPALRSTITLARTFADMMGERQPDRLDAWLVTATDSKLSAWVRFAASIRADYSAVKAALSLVWSNGRTEGFVNRLKCLKRQMYGRGQLDLLRLRLLAT
jgi:transposase